LDYDKQPLRMKNTKRSLHLFNTCKCCWCHSVRLIRQWRNEAGYWQSFATSEGNHNTLGPKWLCSSNLLLSPKEWSRIAIFHKVTATFTAMIASHTVMSKVCAEMFHIYLQLISSSYLCLWFVPISAHILDNKYCQTPQIDSGRQKKISKWK